ncbi:MAG: DUF1573 domain-containing protein [Bacteroidetes bacterium]|nr:DUF1573 domain-containing protein [Bacteroidota bacterium]
MKKLLIVCICGLMTGSVFAQEGSLSAGDLKAAPATATPIAEDALVLKEEVYDFGKIPQGKPVTHIFEVTNKGKAEIKISNVQASCGCTTPEWEKDKAIAPGESTNITVGYNAAAEGNFTKLVTISYGENINKQITIKGEVWKTPASSAPVNAALSDLKN